MTRYFALPVRPDGARLRRAAAVRARGRRARRARQAAIERPARHVQRRRRRRADAVARPSGAPGGRAVPVPGPPVGLVGRLVPPGAASRTSPRSRCVPDLRPGRGHHAGSPSSSASPPARPGEAFETFAAARLAVTTLPRERVEATERRLAQRPGAPCPRRAVDDRPARRRRCPVPDARVIPLDAATAPAGSPPPGPRATSARRGRRPPASARRRPGPRARTGAPPAGTAPSRPTPVAEPRPTTASRPRPPDPLGDARADAAPRPGPSRAARQARGRAGLPAPPADRRLRRSTSSASTPSSPTACCWPALRPLYQHWFRVEIRGLENVPD